MLRHGSRAPFSAPSRCSSSPSACDPDSDPDPAAPASRAPSAAAGPRRAAQLGQPLPEEPGSASGSRGHAGAPRSGPLVRPRPPAPQPAVPRAGVRPPHRRREVHRPGDGPPVYELRGTNGDAGSWKNPPGPLHFGPPCLASFGPPAWPPSAWIGPLWPPLKSCFSPVGLAGRRSIGPCALGGRLV